MNSLNKLKHVLIVSDSYVPYKISAAGMIYNLSREIADRNIHVTCAFSGNNEFKIKDNYNFKGIELIQTNFLNSFRNKSLFLRFMFEISTSLILAVKCYFHLKKKQQLDLIIWYGPSVFLWIVVKVINSSKTIPVYYILRDIFPDWLISLKVVKNFFIIWTLKIISFPQYKVSNIIGVETVENVNYLKKKIKNKKIELLNNWPSISFSNNYKIDEIIEKSFNQVLVKDLYSNVFNFIYIGNKSVAHDYNSLINFFKNFNEFDNILINIFSKTKKSKKKLNKTVTQKNWGLVNDYNFPFIFSKMDFGIVSLNRFAKTSNIPGKFVSYVQFGLPIICFAKMNSSLSKLILKYKCGIVIDLSESHNSNKQRLLFFLKNYKLTKKSLSINAYKLFAENFDSKTIANQILRGKYV